VLYPTNYGVFMLAYNERLSAPVTWWFLAAFCIAVLGAELWAGFGALAALVTYVVLAAVCASFLLHWGSARVRVTDTELLAMGHRLPLGAIGEIMVLDESQTRAIRGPRADPAAYLLIRPYLKRAVYVEVIDPGSTVPYWLIATRRPGELAAAISGSMGRSLGGPSDGSLGGPSDGSLGGPLDGAPARFELGPGQEQ
jgi:Protein of unknown function (DUF3093)